MNFTEEEQKLASFWKGAVLPHIMLNSILTQGKERDFTHRSWKNPKPACCYEWAKWRWLRLQAPRCPKGREGRQGVEVGLQGESCQGSFTERSAGNGTGPSWHYSTALWVNISHTLTFFPDSSMSFHSASFIRKIWTVSLENVYTQVTRSSFVSHKSCPKLMSASYDVSKNIISPGQMAVAHEYAVKFLYKLMTIYV